VGFRADCCHRRTKLGVTAMRWLPMHNAKRESTVLPLIASNVGGDLEQICETVNADRLHGWVEHNPNLVGGTRRCRSSLIRLKKNRRVSLFVSHAMHRSRSASLSLT
jgi:hypothetical protein